MAGEIRITREQADRLTEKMVERILGDEGAGDILQILEKAVITEEGSEIEK